MRIPLVHLDDSCRSGVHSLDSVDGPFSGPYRTCLVSVWPSTQHSALQLMGRLETWSNL
jgi:hypothetical protein